MFPCLTSGDRSKDYELDADDLLGALSDDCPGDDEDHAEGAGPASCTGQGTKRGRGGEAKQSDGKGKGGAKGGGRGGRPQKVCKLSKLSGARSARVRIF